jgi:uncharacterized protein with PQ loop repeat
VGAQVMSITTLLMWWINIGYVIAIVPQIILNYRLKTTVGLSDLYILGYFNAYAAYLFYVYGLNFPIAYKVVSPITLLTVCIIIFQRFFYKVPGSLRLYFYYFTAFFLIIPLFWKYPLGFGKFAGWIAMLTFSMYQLPQVLKIYKTKSVHGFSFYLVSAIALGNIIELIVSWALRWPLQSILISLRGIIIYAIFFIQFCKYSR